MEKEAIKAAISHPDIDLTPWLYEALTDYVHAFSDKIILSQPSARKLLLKLYEERELEKLLSKDDFTTAVDKQELVNLMQEMPSMNSVSICRTILAHNRHEFYDFIAAQTVLISSNQDYLNNKLITLINTATINQLEQITNNWSIQLFEPLKLLIDRLADNLPNKLLTFLTQKFLSTQFYVGDRESFKGKNCTRSRETLNRLHATRIFAIYNHLAKYADRFNFPSRFIDFRDTCQLDQLELTSDGKLHKITGLIMICPGCATITSSKPGATLHKRVCTLFQAIDKSIISPYMFK